MWRNILLAGAILILGITQPATAEPIRIGAVGPLTGPAANSGIAMRQAFQYVAKKTNQEGGVQVGDEMRKIELILEDEQSQPALGVAAATKLLTRDQVDILIGDMFHSSVTLAIMDLVPSFDQTFFMSGQPVSAKMGQRIKQHPERFRNFWKGMFGSAAYADAVWQSVHSLIEAGKLDAGDKRIAFVMQDDDYGRSNIEYVRKLFVDNGWTVMMVGAVPLGHADFYPQLTKLAANPPDLLVSVFSVVNSGIALVTQMEEKQLNIPHLAVYYPLRPEFDQGVPEKAANGLLWTPLFFDPAHNEQHAAFAKAFEAMTGVEANADHAQGVCIMGMLVNNIERAGSVEVDELIEAFKTTDYKCLMGRWVYNLATHTPKAGPKFIPIPVAQIQNGESFVIWPDAIATSEYEPQ